MREYRYSALTSTGQTVSGVRRAESSDLLSTELLQQGLVLLKSRPTLGSLGGIFSASKRAARRELRDFTQHMATCLGAGIPAMTALSDYQNDTTGPFAEVLTDIRGDVSSGTQLDESLARHPHIFSPLYLAMIAAGQNSGNLDESFSELVGYLEWNEDLRSQTSQALIYPGMLLSAIIGLFLLMMMFVIPRFESIFSTANFEMPTLTLRVMALGHFMGTWWWAIFTAIGATLLAARLYFQTDKGAYRRDQILINIPVLGVFQRKLALSRFSKTFSLIFASGVDLLRLLTLLEGVVDNRVMAAQLVTVRQRVSSGESLREAFRDADMFPPLVQRLIAVGEQTGSLDTSLRRASDYLDKEIPRDLKRTFTVFEGVIITLLGVLVCVAALSLLMPIMSIRPGG